MNQYSTDRDWESWGKLDPYYGVLSNDKYKIGNLTEQAADDFFKSGHTHVSNVFDSIHRYLDPNFATQRSLDFGCGTGRLLLPLADISTEVVGVDVSESMLAETQRNAMKQGKQNIKTVKSDDELSMVEGEFDLIHSYIVFQHIPPKRGERICEALLKRLAANGIGVLHFVISNHKSPLKNFISSLRYRFNFLHGVMNVFKGEPFGRPLMQMNVYDLNSLLKLLYASGIKNIHIELVDHYHGVFLGAIIYFKKESLGKTCVCNLN